MEKTFECRPDTTIRAVTERIQTWVEDVVCASRAAARVTVRIEPIPVRVPWPKWAEGIVKMKIGVAWDHGGRGAFLLSGGLSIGHFGRDELGKWPHDETRIAENDNGFVKLSEVPDAK